MFRGSNAYEQKAKRAVPQAPVSLCGRPVVFVNEPAKNVLTMDALQSGSGDGPFAGHRYLKIDATMRTLSVVVADILTKYSFEVTVAQNDEPDEAFGADRPHPSFRESVGPRRSDWRLDHPDSLGAADRASEFSDPSSQGGLIALDYQRAGRKDAHGDLDGVRPT